MTDESGQSYPLTIDSLLDRALGPEGYYGAFVANMHTDTAVHAGSEAIVASAQATRRPDRAQRADARLAGWPKQFVVCGNISWNGSMLSFTVNAPPRVQKHPGDAARWHSAAQL